MIDLQKAGIFKRFSAFLVDALAFILIALCVALILSSVLGFDGYQQTLVDAYGRYEEKYGIDFDITQEQLDALPEETKQLYEQANREINGDETVVRAYFMVQALPLLMISVSVLVASVLLEFVLPLIFKHGRTLGKKIFGLAVVRTNCVKITGPAMFIRAILGKCTMEIMVPICITIMILSGSLGYLGFIVLGLIAILEIVMMAVTKTNSCVHDLISDSVVVDFASQRIFESEEELLETKKKIHEEAVQRADY